ncbi:hypothetical protein PBY51_007894 [Eleginops maclovinus]|uniref:Uncharacterized protein n=1 Tax=Eleginops maclovinus TaxID=56733 RepID=A0AAN8ABA6_ELEMC|nr:hypothetical protein PBY51_007894 [Eleginops maclovinus]
MDKGKREMREGTECQQRKRGRGYFAVQPPSIWPPTQQTALSALKSLAVLCPMWQQLTGIPACRKLGH